MTDKLDTDNYSHSLPLSPTTMPLYTTLSHHAPQLYTHTHECNVKKTPAFLAGVFFEFMSLLLRSHEWEQLRLARRLIHEERKETF